MANDSKQDAPFVVPKLSNSPKLKIDKKSYFTLPCPKCKQDLNVTGIQEGHDIACPLCKNITIVPSFRPRWWHKTRNFILSVIIALVIGIVSSIVGSHIYSDWSQNVDNNSTMQKGDSNGN